MTKLPAMTDPLTPSSANSAEPKRELAMLKDLATHPGWQLLCSLMDAQLLIACKALVGDKFTGHTDHINYQRGLISALTRLPRLLDDNIHRLEQQALMDDAAAAIAASDEQKD